jgi:hypothetical protein
MYVHLLEFYSLIYENARWKTRKAYVLMFPSQSFRILQFVLSSSTIDLNSVLLIHWETYSMKVWRWESNGRGGTYEMPIIVWNAKMLPSSKQRVTATYLESHEFSAQHTIMIPLIHILRFSSYICVGLPCDSFTLSVILNEIWQGSSEQPCVTS